MLGRVADPAKIDTSVPHPARVYDYWLGGKDNFEADRQAAQAAIEIFPHTVQSALACRAFLARVVHYLAGEAGIRQFLDIGTGLPSGDTSTRLPSRPRPTAASSTWTTTRSCCCTRKHC